MRYEDDLRELLDCLDVETYLQINGIEFKATHGSRGRQLNLKECPVCGSSSWKVYLSAETGYGNCFAGDHPPGENYNKWTFIKAWLGDARPADVVKHIRSNVLEMGWVPRRKARATETPPELVLPQSVPLPINGKNLLYLMERGITDEITEYFGLRYCENGWFKYKFNDEEKFQKWGGRVIIPVFDLDGKMVTFQGRDVTGAAEKRYIFPPGLPGTARFLLNAHNARGSKTIAVGEGAFDVMAMKMAFDDALDTRHVTPVGTFGKNLSMNGAPDQLTQLLQMKREGLEEVVMMWDAEPKAIGAAIEAGLTLKSYGFKPRLALLPEGKDPNEVPAAVVREAFFKARPIDTGLLFQFKLGRLK